MSVGIRKHTTMLYPLLLLTISVLIVTRFTFNHLTITSDAAREYGTYLYFIKLGHWQPIADNILSSSIITTLVPAMLQTLIGIEPELLYQIYLTIVLIPLPLVLYLVLSKHTSAIVSFCLSLVLTTTFYFLNAFAYPRVSVAMIFLTLLLGLILSKLTWKIKSVAIVFTSTALVLSHYGTTYATIALFAGSGLLATWYYLIRHRLVLNVKYLTLGLVVLLTASFLWSELPISQAIL